MFGKKVVYTLEDFILLAKANYYKTIQMKTTQKNFPKQKRFGIVVVLVASKLFCPTIEYVVWAGGSESHARSYVQNDLQQAAEEQLIPTYNRVLTALNL